MDINVGEHCEISSCKQLDFLPIKCDGCLKTFCKTHSSYEAHSCEKKELVTDRAEYVGVRSYPCSLSSCTNKELTEILCEHCHKCFCLSHRHQSDHKCEKITKPVEKMEKTAKHVQDIAAKQSQSVSKPKGKGKKSKVTAAKVALMKIKMKAVGTKGLPDEEKIYFDVRLPQGSKEKSKPMYFSKSWSLGKVVDQIAQTAGLQNMNNVGTAKKLRLFDPEDGSMFPCESQLESILNQEVVYNGSTVILEYIDNDKTVLENLDLYK